MGDRKYVRLNPKKMGFTYHGVVPPRRGQLLTKALAILKQDLAEDWNRRLSAREIFWLNLWQDEVADDDQRLEISDPQIADQLDQWCRKAVHKYCERKAILDGYGFVVNPCESKPQAWHIDYSTDAAAVWIPITALTERNAPQYLALPANTPRRALEQVASNVDEVDVDALAREADYLVIQQIVASPLSVFYMGRGTIHRGVANTGDDHRIAFYISVHFIKNYRKNYPYQSESLGGAESAVETFG